MTSRAKDHLPSRYYRSVTACNRLQSGVVMADEPDEGHATCVTCRDDWHFADVNGEQPFDPQLLVQYST